MKTIIVTGSVGTGKTTLSKKLSKILKYKYLDVNKIIKENKELREEYDRKNKCYIINTKKLNKLLIEIIKETKDIIIDSHLSHFLPKRYVNLCIITTCNIEKLAKRLKKRKYSKTKIADNLEAEIFKIIIFEAKKKKHNILIVDTTKRYNLKNISKFITK